MFFRYPWVTAFGGMCYTIYLYHNGIVAAIQGALWDNNLAIGPIPDGVVRAVLLTAATAIGGALLFVLLEKPFMHKDWPARVWCWLTGRPMPAPKPARPIPVEPAVEAEEAVGELVESGASR
jgi:peptidoglycan/LPS O-acetylase OafA/YrhL